MLNKLIYNLVLVYRYKTYIYGIVVVVNSRVDKILLKMVVSDRNM
jgi:hypothetical protein